MSGEEREVTLSRSERDALVEVAAQMRRESRRVFAATVGVVVDRWDGPDKLRSALEWAALEGTQIRDPDGWREGALGAAKGLTELITKAEYEERRNLSTIGPAG